MDELRTVLEDNLNSEFLLAVLSNPRQADGPTKVRIRPVRHKDRQVYQFEAFCGTQVFHQTWRRRRPAGRSWNIWRIFRQMQLETQSAAVSALGEQEGKSDGEEKTAGQEEGAGGNGSQPEEALYPGGGNSGSIPAGSGRDDGGGEDRPYEIRQVRQINRFLEFIQDVLPKLPREREIRILDFGCGKSYLTFAMYYYLHELQGLDVRILDWD